jgi:enterochelin esterase-like enzyme
MKKIIVILLMLSLVFTGCNHRDKKVDNQAKTNEKNSAVEPENKVVTEPLQESKANENDSAVEPTVVAAMEPLQNSKTESVKFMSEALGKEMTMKVYLPKGYDGNTLYPVLYLYHGMKDNETKIAFFTSAADKLIDEGKIEPLVIVAPYTANSFGSNTVTKMASFSDGMYEDYIYKDVRGYINDHYCVDDSRDATYIGGISMGGYIAIHLAFKYPDTFSKVGGHSPALWFEGGLRDWLYYDEKTMKENDPIYLAANSDLKGLKIYLDCGNKDYYGFQDSTQEFYQLLQDNKLDVEFHLNEGDHNYTYWSKKIENYLLFYSPVEK